MVDYAKHYHEIQPKKNKVAIEWLDRYSETMEADKQGRWARDAYSGVFNPMGTKDGKIAIFNEKTKEFIRFED